MAIIETHPLLGDADYATSRWPIIGTFERLFSYVYQDKARGSNAGYATIGAGFLVSANVDRILKGINPNLQANLGLSDAGYIALVTAITQKTRDKLFATNAEAQSAIDGAINSVLSDPSNYLNNQIPSPKPSFSFQYSADSATAYAQMQTTFDLIMAAPDSPESLVDQWLNGDPAETAKALPDSSERMALLSLAYNGLIGFVKDKNGNPVQRSDGTYVLKSPSLRKAILNGDRAEAWYEIRYNSNRLATLYVNNSITTQDDINSIKANVDRGLAKRRFAESELFGLYGKADQVNETDAKGAYRTYTRHRGYVNKYESAYGISGTRGDEIAAANDYNIALADTPLVVSGLSSELKGAYDYLKKTYLDPLNLTTPIPWNHIQVGEDQTTLYYCGTDSDVLIGTTESDLLFGESGADVLQGGGGDDVLYGGPGLDTYLYTPGDGNDTIIDDDAQGVIGREGPHYYQRRRQ